MMLFLGYLMNSGHIGGYLEHQLWFDLGLVLGHQIVVNETYICYGLKLGAIRVLNINRALKALLCGHTQAD